MAARSRSGRRSASGALVVACLVALSIACTAPAAAAAPAPYTSTFGAVSCPTGSFCMAVGQELTQNDDGTSVDSSGFAREWNGVQWRARAVPHAKASTWTSLASVSCVSATFCIATGIQQHANGAPSSPYVVRWNGVKWTEMTSAEPRAAALSTVTSVSCVSAKACLAVGGFRVDSADQGEVWSEQWKGSGWKRVSMPATDPTVLHSLGSISCVSAGWCEAVGFAGNDGATQLVEHWNGTAWVVQHVADGTNAFQSELRGVSCTDVGECIAVGVEAFPVEPFGDRDALLVQQLSGGTWKRSAPHAPDGSDQPQFLTVSCRSASFCVAAGGYADASGVQRILFDHWNGKGWPQHTAGVIRDDDIAHSILGIDCSSRDACLAVGGGIASDYTQQPVAQRWDGDEWRNLDVT